MLKLVLRDDDGANFESGLLSFRSRSVAVVKRDDARLVVEATLRATLLTDAPEDATTGPLPRPWFLFSTLARSECAVATLSRSDVSSTLLSVGRSPVRVSGARKVAAPFAVGVRRSSTGMLISSLISLIAQLSNESKPPSFRIPAQRRRIHRRRSMRVCSTCTRI